MGEDMRYPQCLEVAVRFYSQAADTFHEKTKHWQGIEHMDRFISLLPNSSLPVVDVACGVGRDVDYFMDQKVLAYGIDATLRMVQFARDSFPGCVFEMRDMLSYRYGVQSHRGVWASSCLQEVPKNMLGGFIGKLSTALVPGGVLYSNYRVGDSESVVESSEYGQPAPRLMALHSMAEVDGYLSAHGFEVLSSVDYKIEKHGKVQHKARVFARLKKE